MKRFEPYVFLRGLTSRWDVLAFIVVIGLIVFLGETSRGLFAPLTQLERVPLSLNPSHLPEYAARTTFRMLAGLFLSLIFTLTLERSTASKAATSGLLCMAIVGGAVLPLLMGHIADRFSLRVAYGVPLAAYVCIATFGLLASRIRVATEAAVQT